MGKNLDVSHNVCYAESIISHFAVPLAFNISSNELSTHLFKSDLHLARVTFYSFNGFSWWSLKVGSFPSINSLPYNSESNMVSDVDDTMSIFGFVEIPPTTWRN